jgi:hypothetical protein
MTSRYEIIQKWISSVETEEQFETIQHFVNKELKCEHPKELEDIIDMVCENYNRRSFIRSKIVAVKPVYERFPYDDEQPTDNV